MGLSRPSFSKDGIPSPYTVHPSRCLGVIPDAWALGGPVTHSGNLENDDQCEYDFNGDKDVDGEDLFHTFIDNQDIFAIEEDDLEDFAKEFGRADCLNNS